MRIKTMWYVITGGPGSGKTALIERLKGLGYTTVEEVATSLIESEKKKGKSLEMIRSDESWFQEEVLNRKIEAEDAAFADKVIFFDTAIPCSIPYYIINNLYLGEKLFKASQKREYRGIFFLDQLPFFEKNNVRIEGEEKSAKISRMMLTEYARLGYEVTKVPAVSVEKRVEFILKKTTI